MPHLLELFSGAQGIGNSFRMRGWQVTSVDIDERALPTICCDIMELDAGEIQEYFGPVDLIWASPPYTHHSCPLESDALVSKVLDLADQLCCYYLLENPTQRPSKDSPHHAWYQQRSARLLQVWHGI